MISWIQKYFQHHFKTIFAILLAVTIISFIFTIGASPGIGRADRRVTERQVFGYNLASQDDQARLFGDASLSAELQFGYSPESAEVQSYAYQRAASLALADELHTPAPSKQEIADFIKTLRIFATQDGQFDAQRYATFRDSLKTNPRLSESSVSRVLADDVRIAKVQKLIAGPGYVLPSDVKFKLEQSDASWTLGVATVDYASFNPAIPATDAVVAKFFDENSFRYEIPPRVVVTYADFSAVPLVATINVSEADVRAAYYANPSRYPKPAPDPKAAPKPAASEDPFTAVRAQVETTVKVDRARQLAMKNASDFSYALYERKLTPGTPEFDAFLAAQHIALKPLAPFTREAGPAELGTSPDIAAEAFHLNKERTYSDALAAPAGAVVLFWKETQPTRKPLLSEVRSQVLADYIDGEKRKRFVELGRTLRATIEARLKAGDSFDQAVAAAASANAVKIAAKTTAPFTRRQPPPDLDYSVFGTLERLEKGRVSDMTITKDHGFIVYAADRKFPDFRETNPQFASARAELAAGSARLTMGSYLNDVVTAELKKSEPKPE